MDDIIDLQRKNRSNRTPSQDADHQYDETGESSFEGIGLSPESGWYLSLVLYSGGGALVLAMYAFTSSIPKSVAILGTLSLFASPFFLYGAKRWPRAAWAPHFRITFGLSILAVGTFLMGRPVTAMVLLILFPILATAYLHKPKTAIPYSAVGVFSAFVSIALRNDIPATISTSVVVSMLAACAIYSQYQLRAVAEITNRLSVTDPLTGLANIRRLRTRLREELLSARRSGDRVALFAIDLDDFKQVNDRFSHTVGDELLKAVAVALTESAAASDLVVRRGGDEFAVMCAPIGDRNPEQLRKQFKDAIHKARMQVCPLVNPHGSVGYVLHASGESVEELLQRSDDALHEEKLDAHPERRAEHASTVGDLNAQRLKTHERAGTAAPADHLTSGNAEQVAAELRIARWAQRSLGYQAAWAQAAAMSAVVGLTLAVIRLTDLIPGLDSGIAMMMIGFLFVLSALCLAASRRNTGELELHVAVIALGGALTAIIIEAGSVRYSLLDLYLIPVMFAFYYFRPKHAVPYLVVGLTLFVTQLMSSDFDYVLTRAVETTIVVTMMTVLLSKARKLTRSYTKSAVEMSVLDSLTGVANLRGLRQRVADEIERCNVTGRKMALLAIDLDAFKQVNDRYSHSRGDAVLVATAEAIRLQIRTDELVARRGGDEFAAVLVYEEAEGPEHVSERIAHAIEQARLEIAPDVIGTASIGHVVWEPGEDPDKFLARADVELHGAKQTSHAARTLHAV